MDNWREGSEAEIQIAGMIHFNCRAVVTEEGKMLWEIRIKVD